MAHAVTALDTELQPTAGDLNNFERDPMQNVLMWHLAMGVEERLLPAYNCSEGEEERYGDDLIARYMVTEEDKLRIAKQYDAYAGPRYDLSPNKI